MDEPTTTKPGRGARFWVTIMLGGAAALVVLCVGISLGGLYIADRVGEPGDPVSGVTEVAVKDNKFSPNSIEIESGATVTWTWGESTTTTSTATASNRPSSRPARTSTPSRRAGNTTMNAPCIPE